MSVPHSFSFENLFWRPALWALPAWLCWGHIDNSDSQSSGRRCLVEVMELVKTVRIGAGESHADKVLLVSLWGGRIRSGSLQWNRKSLLHRGPWETGSEQQAQVGIERMRTIASLGKGFVLFCLFFFKKQIEYIFWEAVLPSVNSFRTLPTCPLNSFVNWGTCWTFLCSSVLICKLTS